MNDRVYYVYQHVTPDGMYYFGVTKNPKNRWKPSAYNRTSLKLYIEKYGFENLQHNILLRELTYEEARKTEKMLIESAKEDGCCINKNDSGLVSLEMKGYQKQYYQERKEEYSERGHNWYENNKEDYLEYCKKYRNEHLNECRERSKNYYEKNKEKVLKKQIHWQQENKDKVKEYQRRYYEEHREELNEKQRQRRARKKTENNLHK